MSEMAKPEKKEYPDLVYLPWEKLDGNGINHVLEIVGMTNDLLAAKGADLVITIVPSQQDGLTIEWENDSGRV